MDIGGYDAPVEDEHVVLEPDISTRPSLASSRAGSTLQPAVTGLHLSIGSRTLFA
jgi:hypothetical protein